MADLISRKALESELENTPIRFSFDKSKMFRMIKEAPTVDIVRCKECILWQRHTQTNKGFGRCRNYNATKHEDGFCDR